MIHKIVAIRDRALDAFMTPWYVPALGMAIRAFQDEINKPDTPMHNHPDDYDLYYLGTFDDQKATFDTSTPEQIAIGKQLINK